MRDHTIDEALVELARTMKALKELRHAEKLKREGQQCRRCRLVRLKGQPSCPQCGETAIASYVHVEGLTKRRSAAKRASLDLTRKLADLRAGR